MFSRPGSRPTLPWKILIPVCFAVATMPQWWPYGYLRLLDLPGVGYFRVPARYTLLSSLGLAVLAGEGLDRAISRAQVSAGPRGRYRFRTARGRRGRILDDEARRAPSRRSSADCPAGSSGAALAWSCALVALLAWRSRRVGPWALLVVAAVELGVLFYHGTTEWGWAVELPGQSRVLTELARRSPQGLIGGETGNLPVRLGFKTGPSLPGVRALHLSTGCCC